MRIGLEDFRAFVLVAEMQSFNRAADELSVTQSALSRRMKKLEDALGARLLDRTSRTVGLTVVGQEFLPAAKRMVRDYERSVAEIRDVIQKKAGVVSMAAVMTVAHNALPVAIERFSDDYPSVAVRVFDDVGPKVAEAVAAGEAEFGIALQDDERPELDFTPVVEDPYVLVCHAAHPLAERRAVRWRDLGEYAYIRMGVDTANQRQLERALDGTGLMPRATYEVQHLSTMMGFLSRGLGVSAVPRLGVAQRPDLNLAVRPLTEPVVSRYIGILKVAGRTLSPSAGALCDMATEELRRMAAGTMATRGRRRAAVKGAQA